LRHALTNKQRHANWQKKIIISFLLPIFIAVGVVTGLLPSESTSAATLNTLNFQGRLLTNTGALVADGTYNLEFNLYTADTGGTSQWTESWTGGNAVSVQNGYFSVYLGDITAFPGSISWDQELWLTMNVNGDGEMTPRFKLTAVPYAFRAGAITDAAGNAFTGDDLAQLAPSSVQTVNAAVAALRLNQTGSGAVLQLQGDGGDVFVIDKTGGAVLAGGLTLGASVSTTPGTIRWTGTDFEGYNGSSWDSLTSVGGPSSEAFIDGGNSFGGLAVLGTDDAFGLSFETDNTERLRIDSLGNIGIGQTNPQELLDVNGGIRLGNSTGSNAGTLRWTGTDFEGYNGTDWVSLTEGLSSVSNVSTVIKTTNETVNNSSTLQNDDELFFTVGANEVWAFRFVVQGNSGTTPDFRFAVTAPGGAVCRVGFSDPEGATSNAQYGCGVSTQSIPGNGVNDVYEITGTVTNSGTPGEVRLQWAQFTSNAANTTVFAGSYVTAFPESDYSIPQDSIFIQDGNSFNTTAVLGTTDAYGLQLITNGNAALTISSTGEATFAEVATFNKVATFEQTVSVADGLTILAGGVNVIGNSAISGQLTGLTGLSFTSGDLNVNNGGIINAGSIAGVGTDITALNNLTISSGGTSDLALSSASGLLLFDADTWRRAASGTTTLQLNDSSDTTFSILNNSGSAVANVVVDGSINAAAFTGDGSGIIGLNADNILSGSITDGLLSSNVTLLNAAQTFSGLNTFSSGLVVGNTGSATAGALRFNGIDFEGYDGTQWVSLTSGIGGPSPLGVAIIQAYDSTGGTDVNSATPTAVPWDAETRKDSGFTHSNTIDNSRVYLDDAGWYKVSYQITGANQTGNRNTVFCQLRMNGVAYNTPSGTYAYARNTTDFGTTNSSSVYIETTSTNEYYEVLCSQSGSAGAQLTIAGSSWTIAEKTSELAASSNPFVQGGNTFGATAILGTGDNNSLELITNGVSRLLITNGGEATFSGNLNVSGLSAYAGSVEFNGGVTLGDAAADALTILSSSIIASNGLDFNSGLFVIDALNNRVGINNNSPDGILRVNSPSTLDTSSEVMFATSSLGNKGLVIQGVTGQTANLFESQNSDGEALFIIGANGELGLGLSNATNGLIRFSNDANANSINLSGDLATANRTINLPDADGSLCIAGSVDCGYVLFAQTTAQEDASTNNTIQINKTGASGNILELQRSSNGVFTIANNGAVSVQVTASDAFRVADDSNNQLFVIDTISGLVRVGSATADSTGILLVLDTKNSAGDPTGTDGSIYYNSNLARFRCYEDGDWKDCIGTRQVRSFIDTTADTAADNNTTNYWDTAAENNNSFPNISPATATRTVTGSVSFETQSTTTADRSIVARVERSIGAPAACNSGTPVGTILSTFTTNNGEQASNTMMFLDEPSTTSTVYYTLCADTATSNAAGMTINRVRVTLEEANNSN
jgi:hypothetical protein